MLLVVWKVARPTLTTLLCKAQHNSYTNTDCIYSVYVMVLELIVQNFYLGSNKNRPQPQIVNNIRVIYRFKVAAEGEKQTF